LRADAGWRGKFSLIKKLFRQPERHPIPLLEKFMAGNDVNSPVSWIRQGRFKTDRCPEI